MPADTAKKSKQRGNKLKNGTAESGKGSKGQHAAFPSASREDDSSNTGNKGSQSKDGTKIEALAMFKKMKKAWPEDMMRLFDPQLADERRGELWQVMCEGGESLRQRFAWAVPDERALRVLKHFAPIVEIGSGLGYWAMLLRARGVDIEAYDKVPGAPLPGGAAATGTSSSKRDRNGMKNGSKGGSREESNKGAEEEEEEEEAFSFWTEVKEGGPEKLEEACNENRTLFLCYPDEDEDEDEEEGLGLRCLHAFEGETVIHVGEIFGDSLCMTPGQSPWGRTTSRECQEELVSKFHCILKVPLPRWPHSRDTLTVWKRHEFTAFHYGSSDDEEDSEHDDEGSVDGDDEGKDKAAAVKGDKKDRESASTAPTGSKDGVGAGKTRDKKGATKRPSEGNGAAVDEAHKRKRRREAKDDGSDGDGGSDGAGDGDGDAHGSDVDSEEMMDALLAAGGGMIPDFDVYAFVPEEDQMPCGQAAPCAQFLLKGD